MCTDDDYLGEILVPCVQEALGTDEAETAEILEQNLFHREDMDTDFAEMINSDEIREQPLSKEDAKLLEESEKTACRSQVQSSQCHTSHQKTSRRLVDEPAEGGQTEACEFHARQEHQRGGSPGKASK